MHYFRDLLDRRGTELDENLKSIIQSLFSLKSEIEETIKTEDFTEQQKLEFKNVIKKIDEKPLKAITQVMTRSEILNKDKQQLWIFSEVNWINDFSTL